MKRLRRVRVRALTTDESFDERHCASSSIGHWHLVASELFGDGWLSRFLRARSLDLEDGSVDAVLLLGPLYHLPDRADRLAALKEAARIVRPSGLVVAAAISRWAPRLHGAVAERLYLRYASIDDQIATVERSGRLDPLEPGAFSGYCHRPAQLRAEVRASGLDMVGLENVEGIAFALSDLDDRLSDPRGREVVLDAARALSRVPELLGLGPHMLAIARRARQTGV